MVVVETIEALRARSVRQVTITFGHDVAHDEFSRLPGVSDVSGDARTIVIHTTGHIDDIVKQAARHHVVDFVSEQADLEAVFLAYYGGDGGAPDAGGASNGGVRP